MNEKKDRRVKIPSQIKSDWGKLEWARAILEMKVQKRKKLNKEFARNELDISFLQNKIEELEKIIDESEISAADRIHVFPANEC